jgi:2,4-dienoyl-CoA reductase-like NADH-dependent reductase (Old Yellow Enzyme family)/thioredoxin reductase
LFQPLRIGRATARNRIEAAPCLPILAAEDGSVTPELVEFYRQRAAGGAGIVTVGETSIDIDRAPSHRGQLHLGDDDKIAGLTALAAVIRRHGALASIEINHAGRQTIPDLLEGRAPIGPSPVPSPFNMAQAGRRFEVEEMTLEQIETVAETFATAAGRAQRAGFDMVLLHGGHGWLLSQFVSPLANRRTDRYGGSLEDRARFPLEVLGRIRERCGPDLAIEYRFSADELLPGGLRPEEAVRFAQLIEGHVDLLHVSCGMIAHARTSPYIHAANYLPRGRNVHLAEMVKQAVGKPVTAVGGIVDAAMAEAIVAQGKADVVAMCRALIADPELPAKALAATERAREAAGWRRGRGAVAAGGLGGAEGGASAVGRRGAPRPCVRCNECLARVAAWRPVRCAVNPVAGRELEAAALAPAPVAKKVVVVGGGPAGMVAALVAAGRGHRVVLFERRSFLGGDLVAASRPWFNDDLERFLDHLVASVEASAVEVRLLAPAGADDVGKEHPDAVIVAVGGEPAPHGFSAAPGTAVVWAGDLAGGSEPPGKVVVVGGGVMGCEAALDRACRGFEVTLLHEESRLAEDASLINRSVLLELLRKHGVRAHTNTRLVEVATGRVLADSKTAGAVEFEAQTVVLAPRMRPRAGVGEELARIAEQVLVVGNCRQPGLLLEAVHEGFWAGAAV